MGCATGARRGERGAFTLIELLVVIAIIGLLVGMTLPAVHKVRTAAYRTKAVADIGQIGVCCSIFHGERGENPQVWGGGPNGEFRLCTRYTDAAGQPLTETVAGKVRQWPEIVYLKRIYTHLDLNDNGLRRGGINGVVVPASAPELLDANQAMVFWLTGGQILEFRGFSLNRARPFTPHAPLPPSGQPTGEQRKIVLQVGAERFTDPLTGLTDGRLRDPWGTPYAFFSYDHGIGDYPAVTSNGTTAYRRFARPINAGTYQIVSAGADKKFGPGGLWTPGQGAWGAGQDGHDDLSNFRSLQLGAPDGD